MKQYFNKLVRDKIPDIISNDNKKCVIKILNKNDYNVQLNLKLIEECNEVINAKSDDEKIEELADVLEVIYSIAENMGVNLDHLENVRMKKKLKRGGFASKIFLKYVSNEK